MGGGHPCSAARRPIRRKAPVVVLVDDAHWLDGSSADALLFAFRRLLADPVAVVLAIRQGEPSMLDGADLPTMRLQGLDLAGMRAGYAARKVIRCWRKELADRLHRETGEPAGAARSRERQGLASDLPPDARRFARSTPAWPAFTWMRRSAHFRSAPVTRWPLPPPSTAARCRYWSAPCRHSGLTCPTWFPPRQRA